MTTTPALRFDEQAKQPIGLALTLNEVQQQCGHPARLVGRNAMRHRIVPRPKGRLRFSHAPTSRSGLSMASLIRKGHLRTLISIRITA